MSSPQAITVHCLSYKATYQDSSYDQPLSLTLLKCSLLRRSPAVVVAYLMKHRRWRLTEAYKWVKEHRPETELTSGAPPCPPACNVDSCVTKSLHTSLVS